MASAVAYAPHVPGVAKKMSHGIDALDLSSPFLPVRSSSSKNECGSVSSRSVRRRDVIRPLLSKASSEGSHDSPNSVSRLGDSVDVNSGAMVLHSSALRRRSSSGGREREDGTSVLHSFSRRSGSSGRERSFASSKSIRRRDVIPPLRLKASNDVSVAVNSGALVLHSSEQRRRSSSSGGGGSEGRRSGGSGGGKDRQEERRLVLHSSAQQRRSGSGGKERGDGGALVLHSSSQRRSGSGGRDGNFKNDGSKRSSSSGKAREGALVLRSPSHRRSSSDGKAGGMGVENRFVLMEGHPDPSEVARDRALLLCDGPADPPGESSPGPVVCQDLVPLNSEGGGGGFGGRGRMNYRKVRWVDPKTIKDEGEIDYSVLRQYEEFTASRYENCDESYNSAADYSKLSSSRALSKLSSSRALTTLNSNDATPYTNSTAITDSFTTAATPTKSLLLRNPRTRIATISSGYKKANYFVREDLDTRIYFHQLEDAIGYMGKRGYVKMRREEEDEWRKLLQRAHGVVKVGAKKEKQRYRKGRLVLILKKTIRDHDDPSERRKSKRKSGNPRLMLLENGTTDSRSESSKTDSNSVNSESTGTDRTSLGKSVRGQYKSYSEKFLAEQEEEKRQYMLAIVEGRPLPDAYPDDDGGRLLLTAGADPDEDIRNGGNNLSYNTSTQRNEDFSRESSQVTPGTSAYDSSTDKEELKKSLRTVTSNRKGVYGGGVHYFTPDIPEDSDDDEEDEDDSFQEEEETYESYGSSDNDEGTYDERSEGSKDDNTDTIYCDESDNSMFGDNEETVDYNTNANVESVTSESEYGRSNGSAPTTYKASPGRVRVRRGTRYNAPEMAAISDESVSSGS